MVELAAGYNLKPLDPQAAIAREQLRSLSEFMEARKHNWETLRRGLAALEHVLEFALPTHATAWHPEHGFSWDSSGCRSDCSWFGFKLSVKPGLPKSVIGSSLVQSPHHPAPASP